MDIFFGYEWYIVINNQINTGNIQASTENEKCQRLETIRDDYCTDLDATSVANSIRTCNDLNFANEARRCLCFIKE